MTATTNVSVGLMVFFGIVCMFADLLIPTDFYVCLVIRIMALVFLCYAVCFDPTQRTCVEMGFVLLGMIIGQSLVMVVIFFVCFACLGAVIVYSI